MANARTEPAFLLLSSRVSRSRVYFAGLLFLSSPSSKVRHRASGTWRIVSSCGRGNKAQGVCKKEVRVKREEGRNRRQI